jgi:hypothetical protein
MRAINGLIFILILNIMFAFVNLGMASVDATQQFGYNQSFMNSYNTGTAANPVVRDFSVSELPESKGTVTTGDNPFTDLWITVSSFFTGVGQGIGFLFSMVNSVPNFLSVMGIPAVITFPLAFLWHTFTIFLIIMFFRGE